MKSSKIAAAAVVLTAFAATAACNKGATPAAEAATTTVSEADASAAADATQAAWASGDASKIEALYSPKVVGFDPVDPPLSTTWANWDKLQQGYAAMKFDQVTVPDRKIQALDANHFIASGSAAMTSATGPMKSATMRFTDVYERQADGRWIIVNEHVSMKPPSPAKSG